MTQTTCHCMACDPKSGEIGLDCKAQRKSPTTEYTPMTDGTFAVFNKLRSEIEQFVLINRGCDANDLASTIDDLIVQRIKQLVKL